MKGYEVLLRQLVGEWVQPGPGYQVAERSRQKPEGTESAFALFMASDPRLSAYDSLLGMEQENNYL